MGDNGKVTKERGGRKRARVRVEQTLWIEIIKGDWNYMEMFCSSVSAWQSCITSSSSCSTVGAQRSLQQGCVMANKATDLYAVGGPHFKNLLTVGTTTVKEMPVGSMGQ